MTVQRYPALLLLGPTGSGKTPLGQQIEARSFGGMRCVHFDFGENLREVVARNCPDETITSRDIEFLRGVLASGALLEDEQFPLAERILRSFLARRQADATTCVVLNGLPRHVGQAEAIDAILDIRAVVCLECSGETVLERLASNIGGDRGDRVDDELAGVRRKLQIFHRRTAPLVDHYRRRGVRIETIQVTPTMTAEEAGAILLG
jgi:adenylate kinase